MASLTVDAERGAGIPVGVVGRVRHRSLVEGSTEELRLKLERQQSKIALAERNQDRLEALNEPPVHSDQRQDNKDDNDDHGQVIIGDEVEIDSLNKSSLLKLPSPPVQFKFDEEVISSTNYFFDTESAKSSLYEKKRQRRRFRVIKRMQSQSSQGTSPLGKMLVRMWEEDQQTRRGHGHHNRGHASSRPRRHPSSSTQHNHPPLSANRRNLSPQQDVIQEEDEGGSNSETRHSEGGQGRQPLPPPPLPPPTKPKPGKLLAKSHLRHLMSKFLPLKHAPDSNLQQIGKASGPRQEIEAIKMKLCVHMLHFSAKAGEKEAGLHRFTAVVSPPPLMTAYYCT